MSNTLLNVDEITLEALDVLHNEMSFVRTIDKQHDRSTTLAGRKRGGSIRIRKPAQPVVRSGWTMDAQDFEETYDTLTIGTVRGVDFSFTDDELALNLDDFSRQVLKPGVSRLAAEVEKITIDAMLKATYNQVGTAGTAPGDLDEFADARAKMIQMLAPKSDRHVALNALAEAAIIKGSDGFYHPADDTTRRWREGELGRLAGFTPHTNELLPRLTAGSRAGSILVDGTISTEGETTLHVDGITSATGTFTEGEVITIAGVYAVNPETKQTLSWLQQFVVTADATASSNEVDLELSPAPYTSASGGKQNVDALPQDGAAVTVVGTASNTYDHHLCYHKDAFTFATAKLEMPNDVDFKAQKEMDGISIRVLRQYDIVSAQYNCRLDIFFGSLAQRPQHACRIVG